MLPFTPAQFFEIFGAYNDAIWPMQIAIYVVALPAIALLFRPTSAGDRIVSGILALMWIWTGVAYHWMHFYAINPAALVFGLGFVLQGAVFLIVGVSRNDIQFGYTRGSRSIIGLCLILYAALIYPVAGLAFGHAYPDVPLFGVTPCPVAIFTFGCFLLLRQPIRWWVVVLPVLWSLVGGTAAFLLNVPQDWLLLMSGVGTAVLLAAKQPRLLR